MTRPTRRTKIVWSTFVAAMTLVVGLLALGDGDRPGGFLATNLSSIPLQSSPGDGGGFDPVFQIEAPLDRDRWTGIVIHHLGAPAGDAESIHRQHVGFGYQGLGYHFLIGNGNGLGDGVVHVGYRWNQQLPGAHTVGPQSARAQSAVDRHLPDRQWRSATIHRAADPPPWDPGSTTAAGAEHRGSVGLAPSRSGSHGDQPRPVLPHGPVRSGAGAPAGLIRIPGPNTLPRGQSGFARDRFGGRERLLLVSSPSLSVPGLLKIVIFHRPKGMSWIPHDASCWYTV